MVFFLRRATQRRVKGKVVVLGATTVVGQPLSLLLKLCPHVMDLCCCSYTNNGQCKPPMLSSRGAVADLSHIDTNATVRAFDNPCEWEQAFHGAQLVLFCSNTPCDPLMAHRDVTLTESVPELMLAMEIMAKTAPKAVVGIVSGFVNALVPVAREVLIRHSVFDPRKLFGVTTLDVIRTRTLVAQELQMNPYDVNVPVVGGRGGLTACPLVTQTGLQIPYERVISICKKVQSYGVNNYDNNFTSGESASCLNDAQFTRLSLAYAVFEWSVSILKALRGDRGIIECAYVESTMRKEVPFFSSRVELDEEGVTQLLPLGLLASYEAELLETAVPLIAEDVEAGLRIAAKKT